eukprot:1161641-Amphidinium_carterae.1
MSGHGGHSDVKPLRKKGPLAGGNGYTASPPISGPHAHLTAKPHSPSSCCHLRVHSGQVVRPRVPGTKDRLNASNRDISE